MCLRRLYWYRNMATLPSGVGVIRSGATLIIAPATLLGQWERELRDKHVGGAHLKILKVSRTSAPEWQAFQHPYVSPNENFGTVSGRNMQDPSKFNHLVSKLVRARISIP